MRGDMKKGMRPGEAITDASTTLAERLEQGELVVFAPGAVPLPTDDDLGFLRSRQLRHRSQHAIQFDPITTRLSGQRSTTAHDAERLAQIMRQFSATMTAWLANL